MAILAPCPSLTTAEGVCPLFPQSLHWIFSLLVQANWKRSQADEAVWMLSEYHRVSIQSHLQHVVPDVVCVIALAESFICQGGDVVILHGETKYHSFLMAQKLGCVMLYMFLVCGHD